MSGLAEYGSALYDAEAVYRPGQPCPTCSNPLRHSGMLHQPMPNEARLEVPVPLLRCWGCRKTLRADGEEYDEEAIRAAWEACRAEVDAERFRGMRPPGGKRGR